MMPQGSYEMRTINEDNKRAWNLNARAWDAAQGAQGNEFQRELVFPAAEQLLEVPTRHYEKFLEIGCGNGSFARRLSKLEVADYILASDYSEEQLACARSRTPSHEHPNIHFRALDATRRTDLEALGEAVFDTAVLNMVVMDMPDIQALAGGLRHVLKPGGVIVLVLSHPCFNTTVERVIEKAGLPSPQASAHIKIRSYLGMGTSKGVAVPDQPEQQFYFHRPFSAVFSAFFDQGFVLNGFLEPALQPPLDYIPEKASIKSFMWYEFSEFPWVAGMRFLLPHIV